MNRVQLILNQLTDLFFRFIQVSDHRYGPEVPVSSFVHPQSRDTVMSLLSTSDSIMNTVDLILNHFSGYH